MLHPPHLVDVHGGAGPAQAPELGDHGEGGLGGGLTGHSGGGTRPSGQPLVTTPGCWIEAPMGKSPSSDPLEAVDPLVPLSLPSATPSHHTIDGGRAV